MDLTTDTSRKSAGNAAIIGLIVILIVIIAAIFLIKGRGSQGSLTSYAPIATPSSTNSASGSINSGDPQIDQDAKAIDNDMNQVNQDINNAAIPSPSDLNNI